MLLIFMFYFLLVYWSAIKLHGNLQPIHQTHTFNLLCLPLKYLLLIKLCIYILTDEMCLGFVQNNVEGVEMCGSLDDMMLTMT